MARKFNNKIDFMEIAMANTNSTPTNTLNIGIFITHFE